MSINLLGKQFDHTANTLLCESVSEFQRPRQRRHELWILTCYININILKKLINNLTEKIRLTNVYIAYDLSEAYREGPNHFTEQINKLTQWCQSREISLETQALAAGNLVHSKAYAVTQRIDGEISDGITLITSANFTEAGFFGAKNIELGYLSKRKKDILDFEKTYNHLWTHYGKELDDALLSENKYLFKYALLQSGIFLHKWDGSISQSIGIRYNLTESAKAQSNFNPELRALGVEPGDTFTRQVLNLKELPPKAIPPAFARNCTIETYWGRWCPHSVWSEVVSRLGDSAPFFEAFKESTTEEKLYLIGLNAERVQNTLLERNLIELVSPDHISNWKNRVTNLRENEQKLERLFTGYEENSMPYDVSSQKDVERLFENLSESISISGHKNFVMNKVLNAINLRSLASLELDSFEVSKIEKLMSEP